MESQHMPSMHDFQVQNLSMPQMASFAPQQQSQQSPDTADRARAYKSRNKRPCDFCRYKKAACHLDSHPPCELCIRYNKECTFVESPAKRRRPNEENSERSQKSNGIHEYSHEYRHDRNSSISSSHFGNGAFGSSTDMQQELFGWENGMASFQMPSMGLNNGMGQPEFALDPAFYQDPSMSHFDPFEPISATTINPMDSKLPQLHHGGSSIESNRSPQSSSAVLHQSLSLPFESTSGEPSLDQQESSNSLIVGLSGESDPYLLSKYRYDEHSEAAFQSIRIRKVNDGSVGDSTIPTFFTIQHNQLASKAQPPEKLETIERFRRDVQDMVGDEVGIRLIRLFYKYIQPYFPILRREGGNSVRDEDGVREPSGVPTCLLAAIYGHALPFCAWDEKLCIDVYTPPSADALFRIAWLACLPMLHTPCLAVLQALLLLVQRRPTNKYVSDTPFKGVMMSAAVSIAQSLGINRDPADWPLPAWEIKQRRRLAWATYIQDKWLALNSGRPGHIQANDWDMAMLSEEDFAEQDRNVERAINLPTGEPLLHFTKLCELTQIVEDILRDLFSVKATKALHGNLEATLDAVKPLRLRLTEWYQSLPVGHFAQRNHDSPNGNFRRNSSLQHELNGNGSLQLAYVTAKIELFRAMLRPRATDANATAVSALRTGAIAVAREISEFLEGLNARELEAFWASYSRTNFTIASSFMLLLFVTSPNVADAKECLTLLNAWRSLLKIKSRSCDLLNLALLRLDGVFVAGIDQLIELSPASAQAWNDSEQGKLR